MFLLPLNLQPLRAFLASHHPCAHETQEYWSSQSLVRFWRMSTVKLLLMATSNGRGGIRQTWARSLAVSGSPVTSLYMGDIHSDLLFLLGGTIPSDTEDKIQLILIRAPVVLLLPSLASVSLGDEAAWCQRPFQL